MPGGCTHPRMHFPWCAVINICVCVCFGADHGSWMQECATVMCSCSCKSDPEFFVAAGAHMCVYSYYEGAQIKINVGI